jgi:hypothetical protein
MQITKRKDRACSPLNRSVSFGCALRAGCEIYLRSLAECQLDALASPATTFAQLSERCRLRDETALGFTLDGARFVMAPPPETVRNLTWQTDRHFR